MMHGVVYHMLGFNPFQSSSSTTTTANTNNNSSNDSINDEKNDMHSKVLAALSKLDECGIMERQWALFCKMNASEKKTIASAFFGVVMMAGFSLSLVLQSTVGSRGGNTFSSPLFFRHSSFVFPVATMLMEEYTLSSKRTSVFGDIVQSSPRQVLAEEKNEQKHHRMILSPLPPPPPRTLVLGLTHSTSTHPLPSHRGQHRYGSIEPRQWRSVPTNFDAVLTFPVSKPTNCKNVSKAGVVVVPKGSPVVRLAHTRFSSNSCTSAMMELPLEAWNPTTADFSFSLFSGGVGIGGGNSVINNQTCHSPPHNEVCRLREKINNKAQQKALIASCAAEIVELSLLQKYKDLILYGSGPSSKDVIVEKLLGRLSSAAYSLSVANLESHPSSKKDASARINETKTASTARTMMSMNRLEKGEYEVAATTVQSLSILPSYTSDVTCIPVWPKSLVVVRDLICRRSMAVVTSPAAAKSGGAVCEKVDGVFHCSIGTNNQLIPSSRSVSTVSEVRLLESWLGALKKSTSSSSSNQRKLADSLPHTSRKHFGVSQQRQIS